MNKQIILSALEAQLKTKQSEMEVYENDVVKPAYQEQSDKIFRWFLENVSSLIPQVSATSDRIEIMKCGDNRRWSACTIQLTTDWRSESRSKYAEFNWYSSRANGKETDLLADVQIFGAVASKFHEIENMMISEWHPAFVEIYKDFNKMEMECNNMNSMIYTTKQEIINESKNQYRKAGFSCELNAKKDIHTNWDTNEVTLIDKKHEIKLQIGRNRFDYVYVSAFKVKEINKYKCILEVSNENNRLSNKEFTITAKRYDEFINEVFNWQNGGSESDSKYTTDRFNRRYAKQETAE
jgi:hypothetical protein